MKKRVITWEKKLLDTGKRNRLINFRKSIQSTVELQLDDFFEFYNSFIQAPYYEFAKLFDELPDFIDLTEEEIDGRLANALGKTVTYKDRYEKEEIVEIRKKFKPLKNRKYIYSTSIYDRLIRTLTLLKKKGQMYYEENGVNALYLCFGFLEYNEPKDKETYLAPLVLLPVEIIQKSIKDPFRIRALDDAYNVNENLIRKFKTELKVDFRPSKSDLDMQSYLAEIEAKAIKCGFKVNYDCWLGLFSFSKIMMYQDILDNEDKIMNSEVLKAFCNLDSKLKNTNIIEDINLDTCESMREQNQVLNADSSQYKAIYYAKKGVSFVLQGPPGTGKSQTITNILAELIGQDKKVLFVCEKKSALEVVYRNLKSRDLQKYALPLFDTKANKKDIVKDIYQNLESIQDNRFEMSKEALEILNTVESCKESIQKYNNEVTKKRKPINMSLYELSSILHSNYFLPDMDFMINNILDVTASEYKDYISKIGILAQMVSKLGQNPESHPFYLFNKDSLSLTESKKIKSNILLACNELSSLNKILAGLREKIGIEIVDFSKINDIVKYLSAISLDIDVPDHYYQYTNVSTILDEFYLCKNLLCEYKEIKKYLNTKYINSFIDLEPEEYLAKLKEYRSTIKRIGFGYKKLEKEVRNYLINPRELTHAEMVKDFTKINELISKKEEISKYEVNLKEKFSDYYFGTLTNFDELEEILKYLVNIEKGKKHVNIIIDYEKYISIIEDPLTSVYLNDVIKALRSSINTTFDALDNLNIYFDYNIKAENPMVLLSKLNAQRLEFDKIFEYVDFNNAYKSVDERLSKFKIEVLQKKISTIHFVDAFKKRFSELYIDAYIETHANLAKYGDTYMNVLLANYQTNDKKTLDISKVKIHQNVTESWPHLNGVMANNLEVKTLSEEANKRRKLKTLRTLFSEIPLILMDLKPIFMMSPLSVATYLNSPQFHFDCVIFDEASQITTENAIGAMYRADQVIIVGDNEQLPPTSFFDSVEEDMEEQENYDVYESILDEALTSLPKIMLKWHYRSKDESLIEFSNDQIYHDLTTFPSEKKLPNLGVKHICCENAIYEHGKRVNKEEAKKVVSLIMDHVKNYPSKSLGVVTFNISQQRYIEYLLNKEKYHHPEIEDFFSEDKLESFFVKNLETVQGDERDVIILSTTFGRDSSNKFSMNFGPINKEGGYRRLNVAITRAKEKVILCTSMKPDDFNLERTSNRGVIMLHDYIAYANKVSKNEFISNPTNDGIILSVKGFLESKGYKCVTNLGTSAYKIDLAVLNPKNEEECMLAVLCDGSNYQSLKTIRDRNHLMDCVLRDRGWNIYHIWSLSFNKKRNAILDEIMSILTKNDTNNNVLEINESSFAQKTESFDVKVENLFDVYPDVKSIIARYTNSLLDKTEILNKILKEVTPIKIDDLKKLVLPIYSKTRLTPQLSDTIDNDLKPLFDSKSYFKVIGFVLSISNNYGVNFRRYNQGLFYPSIDGIYPDELEHGLLTIIKEIKTTSKPILYQTFNELVGYAKGSSLTTSKFDRAIENLQEFGSITVNKNIIEYNS